MDKEDRIMKILRNSQYQRAKGEIRAVISTLETAGAVLVFKKAMDKFFEEVESAGIVSGLHG